MRSPQKNADNRTYVAYTQIAPISGFGLTATLSAPASQAECLAESAMLQSNCAATVAQAETCLKSIATCDPSDDDAASADCNALFGCYTTGP